MRQKSRYKALFSIFHEKISALMPIFCKIMSSLYKSHCSHAHIVKKTDILSKILYSHVIFFQLLHEKPPAVMPIFDQKKSILSTQNYITDLKVHWMPLFYNFSATKSPLSYPYFVKKTSILKKSQCS